MRTINKAYQLSVKVMTQIEICVCKINKCLLSNKDCRQDNDGKFHRAVILGEIQAEIPCPPPEKIIAENNACWWVETEPNTAIKLPKKVPKRGDLIMAKCGNNWRPIIFKCFTRKGEAIVDLGGTQWYAEWRLPTDEDLEFIYETSSK